MNARIKVEAMPKTVITVIPGIGKTFAKDFARIGMKNVEDFQNEHADAF